MAVSLKAITIPEKFMLSKFRHILYRALGAPPQKDLYCALFFASMATMLHIYGATVVMLKPVELEVFISPFIPRMLVLIGVCLIVSTLGLCMRSAIGLLVSLSGLLGSGVGYSLWYISSLQTMNLLAVNPYYKTHPEAVPPHYLGFVGAEWWNLVVLVVIAFLVIWELKALLKGFSQRQNDSLRR